MIGKIFRQLSRRAVRGLKHFLRACYRLGIPTCLFCAGVVVFAIVAVALLISVPKARRARAASSAPLSATAAPAVQTGSTPQQAPAVYGTYGDPDPSDPFETSTAPLPGDSPEPSLEPIPTPEPTPVIQYERGDKGEEITKIQQRLMKLGYMAADEPTTYFGPATKTSVQLFQRQHGLQTDGIVGNQTYDLLMSRNAKEYVMREGDEGDDIESFQEMLYDLGYLSRNKITGYYGSDTVAAVQAFQKRNHLAQDGKAGEMTIEKINDSRARPSAAREKEIEQEKKKAAAEAAKKSLEGRINTLIKAAEAQLGKPYVLGARGPDEFDCSGLVWYCLKKADVYTRRTNAAGYSRNSSWAKIDSLDKLKKGDLIFFTSDSSSSIGHVAIYVGSGTMIDASSSEGKVVKRSCRGSWSKRNFYCGRRPIS